MGVLRIPKLVGLDTGESWRKLFSDINNLIILETEVAALIKLS